MTIALSFIFGVHCHQPVGQLESVIDRTADDCYFPFFRAVEEFPSFKLCAHFSGALLQQIEPRRPELIALIKTLVGRGQIELIGGAMYDPILSALPEADRSGQIRRFSDYLEKKFGNRPKGFWPAHLAWEPHLCRPIREAGIEFIFLDEQHVVAAGVDARGIHGVYLTEDSGHRLKILPINRNMGDAIAKKSVAAAVGAIREKAATGTDSSGLVLTFMDDIEKFSGRGGDGERGRDWTNAFLEAVQGIETVMISTPTEAIPKSAATGPIYIPPISAGGMWRGFFYNYPESNWTHKRVFGAAQKMGPVLDKLGSDREARAIRDLLDRAWCSDVYQRDDSGGLYAPHLRHAVFANLLEAETRFSKKMGVFPAIEEDDTDCDGQPELLAAVDDWIIAVKPAMGGGVIEWSFRPAYYNFQNTLTRRPEACHQSADPKPRRIILTPTGGESDDATRDVRRDIVYDRYRKSSGLLHALDPAVSLDDFKTQSLPEKTAADGPYECKTETRPETFSIHLKRNAGGFSFEKHIVISKHESRISVSASMQGPAVKNPAVLGMGLELFYSSESHLAVKFADSGSPGRFEGEFRGEGAEIEDGISRTRLRLTSDRPIRWMTVPSYTVSKSDSGLDKTFQGLSMLLVCEESDVPRQNLALTIDAGQIAGL